MYISAGFRQGWLGFLKLVKNWVKRVIFSTQSTTMHFFYSFSMFFFRFFFNAFFSLLFRLKKKQSRRETRDSMFFFTILFREKKNENWRATRARGGRPRSQARCRLGGRRKHPGGATDSARSAGVKLFGKNFNLKKWMKNLNTIWKKK